MFFKLTAKKIQGESKKSGDGVYSLHEIINGKILCIFFFYTYTHIIYVNKTFFSSNRKEVTTMFEKCKMPCLLERIRGAVTSKDADLMGWFI